MKIEKDGSLTIADFQEGVGQSPLTPNFDMMGINLDRQGVASANFKFNRLAEKIEPVAFTAGTNDVITTITANLVYRGNSSYMAVTVSSSGTLPAGLTANTIYYLWQLTANTFKLSTTLKNAQAGTFVDITGTGTGTHLITPVMPSLIKYWTKSADGYTFCQDSDNRVWFFTEKNLVDGYCVLIAGNTLSGNGNGLLYYKGFILSFNAGGIDALSAYNDVSDTITWTNNFDGVDISTVDDGMPFLSVNDDSIYFYNGVVFGRYHQIGMLEEVVGKTFSPTDGTTFSCVIDALTIPSQNKPTAINEISEYLIIGTDSDKVFFWDKKSPSFTTFISLPESNANSISVMNNLAYIPAGINGSVYVVNTVSAERLLKLPEQMTNQYYGNIEINWTCSSAYQKELLLGCNIGYTNYVISYNLETKKLTKKNIATTGETNTYSGLYGGYIGSIFVNGDNVLIGNFNNNNNNLDTYTIESLLYKPEIGAGTASYYVYNNYEPYIITETLSVGSVYNKKTYREIELSLLRPLVATQGVKVSYRRQDSGAWTVLKTINYTTYSGIQNFKLETPIEDILDIQFKIELAGVNLTSPMIRYIRFIK